MWQYVLDRGQRLLVARLLVACEIFRAPVQIRNRCHVVHERRTLVSPSVSGKSRTLLINARGSAAADPPDIIR